MSAALFSLQSQRQLEQSGAALGLMRRAACAAAHWIMARYPARAAITVLAGPGNNGGDALHLACELLNAGYAVTVISPQKQSSAEAQAARARWDACAMATYTSLPDTHTDLIVDGLFGIGLSRPLASPWDALIAQVNASGVPVLALDTPSGLDAMSGHAPDAAIRAAHTLTFLCFKPGLLTADGSELAGEVHLATLDVPPTLLPTQEGELNRPGVTALKRHANSHKGSFGTVCIVGGAPGMLGAALLAGRAALAGGTGKVLLATLDSRLAVDTTQPELMISPLSLPLAPHSVCAIGPGLGTSTAAQAALAAVLASDTPLVIDADALNLLAHDAGLFATLATRQLPAILTPHPAEAARLLGISSAEVQADRLTAARTLAARLNKVVVLKGAGSLIVRPDGFYRINASGNAALAVAGQGDVLTGAIAALLAQQLSPFDAASLAVHLHGLVADLYVNTAGGPVGLAASATATALSGLINALLCVQNTGQ